jgi:HAD superfamily hydrolase (TIGR01458 family)
MDAPRGIVFDMEGVLHVGYEPLPGASAAVAALDAAAIPHVILTNTTSKTRATIAARLGEMGMPYPSQRIVTAASATIAFLRRRHAGRRVLLLAEPAAFAEIATEGGIELVEDGREAEVVCLGGPDESITYAHLQEAFRALMGGAAFVAMQRNRWWPTPDGPGLDAGVFVKGLEYASGRRATVIGKPAAGAYRAALAVLGVPAADAMMVGDDPVADLATAHRIGLRTCLVRTGKGATFAAPWPTADLDLPSVSALPEALGLR